MDRLALSAEPGKRVLMLGNEAVARGAVEAGVAVVSAYPGTPSTEIVEALAENAEKLGIYVEWSVNEKVALEVGIGASMCGARSLVVMKHVGLNVAADPFMSLGYAGVEGGLVLVSADDPNAHSSQNEQDNRLYGMHAYVPVFEPSSPGEAKELARRLFEVSEKYGCAVMLRTTTRISHTRGIVVLGELAEPVRGGVFRRKPRRRVLLPVNSRVLHREAIDRIERIAEEDPLGEFNRIRWGDGDVAVVACGAAYPYAVEGLEMLKLEVEPTLVKLSMVYPLPRRLLSQVLKRSSRVLVVEELEPVVELQLRSLAAEEGLDVEIVGKRLVPRVGELDSAKAARAIAEFLGVEWSPPRQVGAGVDLPPRPPTFCPGCGHRAAFYAIKKAVSKMGVSAVFPGDIGCYTLGFFPPFELVDLSFSMGSGVGIGEGICRASNQVVIATIGDSTFFHAGIPALVNAVYNKAPVVVVVMDNGVTAMTGHQPHPGSGVTASGKQAQAVKIEDIARAIGVGYVRVVDPYNIDAMVAAVCDAVRHAAETGSPAVVIARRPCALLERRRAPRRSPYVVDSSTCRGCGVCYRDFACPAIIRGNDGKARILEAVCVGCGVCASICPFNAIRPKEGGEHG